MALVTLGEWEAAHDACPDLLDIADQVDNPGAKAFASLAYGYAWRNKDSEAAYKALRRGLVIAGQSGNRMIESYLAVNMSSFGVAYGGVPETLDLLTLALNNFHDSGSYSHMVAPLGVLAANLERLGHHRAAATIIGFAATDFAFAAFPELAAVIARLHDGLGVDSYEALAAAGRATTPGAMAAYALMQLELVRTEFE